MNLTSVIPPLVDDNCRILVLGSEPGRTALNTGQYYPHPDNKFWTILYSVFAEKLSDDYAQRSAFILKHNIALWDVLINCSHISKKAHSINDEVPNDFYDFYTRYPNIRHIFFNGTLAFDMYDDHIGWKQHKIDYTILPSTSAADHRKTLEEKLKEWQKVKDYLENINHDGDYTYNI